MHVLIGTAARESNSRPVPAFRPATALIDSQVLLPAKYIPTALRKTLAWYCETFKDPLMIKMVLFHGVLDFSTNKLCQLKFSLCFAYSPFGSRRVSVWKWRFNFPFSS